MIKRRPNAAYTLMLPVALLTFAGYFVYAAVQGEYGVFRRVELQAEKDLLEAELALLEAQAAELRQRTRHLSDDYLDLDLLDERARIVLGVARVDEIVIE
ncbi:MAG: septum formation initiator family protein [Pseudomonadota bacterium]